MINFFISVIIVVVLMLYLLSSIAFIRAKNIYQMLQIIKITNFYIMPLMLLSLELQRFSWISFGKIIFIIFLNFIITFFIIQLFCTKLNETSLD